METIVIANLVALFAILAGCILLYVRLRNVPCASFLISIVGLGVYDVWGRDALERVLISHSSAVTTNGALLAVVGQSRVISAAGESVFFLWFGISFFCTIKSIKSQRAA